ncbi:host specificity protein J [Escherichia coli]
MRAINSYGQQGEPATTSFRINAPAAPATIELIPGYFQITAVPRSAVYDPTVQFEFWFSENQITDIRQVDDSPLIGTAMYWTAASINIRPGHDYYFYIRSVNIVGKSAFVEAVGQPVNDAEVYLNFFEGKINSTLLGQELNDRINASALRSEVEQLEDEINQQIESDIAEVTQKIGRQKTASRSWLRKK